MVINYGFNTSLDQWTKDRQQYKDTKKKEAAQKAEMQRQVQGDVLFDCAINSTDQHTIQQYTSASNLNDLAISIGKWIKETTGKDLKPGISDNDVVCSYLNKYPEKERDVNNYLSNKTTLEEAQNKLGLYRTIPNENQYIESDTTADKAKRWGVGLLGVTSAAGGIDLGTNLVGRGMSWYGNRMLEKDKQFLPTQQGAEYEIDFGGNKRLLEDDLKTAQDELKRIQSEGGDTTKIEKQIQEIEKSIDDLTNKKNPVSVSDTAKKFNLGSYSNKTLTEQGAAEEAAKIQKKIFRDYFMPILKKNKTTIDVQKIINSLDDIAEGIVDPGTQSEAFDAIEALKEEYQGERFKNLPSEKVQKLKSDLYADVPEKKWKGKTITNKYKDMKAELAKRIRKAELDIIDESIKKGNVPDVEIFKGEKAQDLFRHYNNLDVIKERGAKALTKPTEMPEMISKVPIIGEVTSPIGDVRTPASRGLANKLVQRGDALKNNTLGKGAKKIFGQFSEVLGKIGKASKVEDPAGIMGLMQLYFEGIDSLLGANGGEGKKVSDAIGDYALIQAQEAMAQMEDFYMTWDAMTDDARVYTIVDMWKQLGKDVSYEDAKYSYEKWKGENGGGGSKLFWDNGNFPLYKSTDDINKNLKPNENMPDSVYRLSYQNAKSDGERIKLIMKRYGVDEEKAKEMLPRMTASGEYNTEYIDNGKALPNGVYVTYGEEA